MTNSALGSKDMPTKTFMEKAAYALSVPRPTINDEDMQLSLPFGTDVIGAAIAGHGFDLSSPMALNLTRNSSGRKDDGGKPRWDLLDAEYLDGTAAVLAFGATKYNPHNWRGGISTSRLIAAMGRHYGAILRGEDVDPESGLPHWAHLSCCVMFFSWMVKHRPDLDDRFKYALHQN